MIASMLALFVLAVVVALGYREGRLGELGSVGWLGACLGILALVSYVGQRD